MLFRSHGRPEKQRRRTGGHDTADSVGPAEEQGQLATVQSRDQKRLGREQLAPRRCCRTTSSAADSTGTVRDESRKVRFVTADVAILDVDNAVTRSSGTTRNHATFVYARRNGAWTSVAQRVIAKP